ncbi:hypothetical protein F5984_11705 [Rudanella paleaurantiibacter]|uniref:Uncharacterized protein n=1 Tax=Rudanella paleaurantiibacter TaxID=2614655 RepID=A0A7J5U118_9BACT|nr:hypothetical protein [Rudanella paleaurantiibacter]KAB7731446.1 hypothetical protein F5984_11705 [Rudanella paleaurantiibacter]
MELIEKQTAPLNPFARLFVVLWVMALVAVAGFQAVKPAVSKGGPHYETGKKVVLIRHAR